MAREGQVLGSAGLLEEEGGLSRWQLSRCYIAPDGRPPAFAADTHRPL